MISANLADPVRALSSKVEFIAGECDLHGKFTTSRLRGTDAATCPKCFDVKLNKESAAEAFNRRVSILVETAHIPQRYADIGFNGFKTEGNPRKVAAVETIATFMRQIRNSQFSPSWSILILTGGVGTGKTHLVCALGNNLISRGVSVRYTTAQAMLADIKRAYSTDGMTEASQIENYVNGASLLIIDEADVQRGTDNDTGLIFAVVNGRYNAGRPMAMVSNQPVTAMPEFLGDRVASRMNENATSVVCDWGDYRRKA